MAEESQNKTLYNLVMEKVDIAKAKVEELRGKLMDFDAKESGREKASTYLNFALDKTQEALADLTKQAQSLKDNATEIPVRAFSNAFARVNDSLVDVKDKARHFDEQHQLSTKVTDIVQNPREQATVAIAAASSYVAEAAHSAYAQLQGVSDGIKVRVMAVADQGVGKVMPVAASYDEKLHITEGAQVIAQHVKDFNEKFHVSDKLVDFDKRWSVTAYLSSALSSALSLDQRITGGKVEPAVTSAYEMGLQMAGYLKDKYEEGKTKAAADASSAPKAQEPDTEEKGKSPKAATKPQEPVPAPAAAAQES